MTAKYKLFTHTDLDGGGCAIVAYHMLDSVDVTYCDYHNVNEKIAEFIRAGNATDYDTVFITDISVNEDVAKLIDESDATWQLIDHHPTALRLNERPWASVTVEDETGKTSGTSLLYEFLGGGRPLLQGFVETVRRYDTWEWSTRYDNDHPKQLNDLFFLIGRERFVDRFTENLSVVFNETESVLLELEQEKIDRLVEAKQKALMKVDVLHYKAGVIFSETHQSELGNRLAKANLDLDFIAIVSPGKSVSLRTVKELDLGKVASHFGGGGHPKAAGVPIPQEKALTFIGNIFAEGAVT